MNNNDKILDLTINQLKTAWSRNDPAASVVAANKVTDSHLDASVVLTWLREASSVVPVAGRELAAGVVSNLGAGTIKQSRIYCQKRIAT